jgi:hypothetical protein
VGNHKHLWTSAGREENNLSSGSQSKGVKYELAFLLGGHFNMIRFPWEKSSDNDNLYWMNLFNTFILDFGLLELIRMGSKYTLTNKQLNLVMSVLDRVLTCPMGFALQKHIL